MAFADELYKAAAPIWEAQLKHPFVQGLGDGTLPREPFQRWLRQDYAFLVDYARLLAWAAARADTLESMRWFSSLLHLTLNTELALHKQYAARYGLDAEELDEEARWPTTQAYTDFLVRTAAEGETGGRSGAVVASPIVALRCEGRAKRPDQGLPVRAPVKQ